VNALQNFRQKEVGRMRRYHVLRYDIWLCLALSMLIAMGTAKLANLVMDYTYESYVEAHEVAAGEVGGVAGENVFRAQNVADLLSHDTFTIVSPGIEYCNRGAGYYKNWYMHAVTLPSGELVAAVINSDSLQHSGDSIYSGDTTLPVGRVVYEDLTENEYFIAQIEYSEPLSRRDFYIDMVGTGGKLREEDYREVPTLLVELGTVFLCFPLLHMLGSKLGIFPYFFAPREKKPKKRKDDMWD